MFSFILANHISMIKFFGKIRENVLIENKTGKYLKYALGEIILVVIGILIALSINNWNENRKLDRKRENYYNQLITDLNSDIAYSKTLVSAFKNDLEQYEDYKRTFNNPGLNASTTIQNLSKFQYSAQPMEFETNTIKTLINTGEISLLPQNINMVITKYLGHHNSLIDANNLNGAEMIKMLNAATTSGANPSLLARIQNQPELIKELNIANNYQQIILQLEAFLFWQELTSETSIYNLNALIQEADSTISIVRNELN